MWIWIWILLDGDTPYGTRYPPHTSHPTNPTPRPTPRPTPQSREFDLFGSECGYVLNVFEFENFLENELNVHFQDFENGMWIIYFDFLNVILRQTFLSFVVSVIFFLTGKRTGTNPVSFCFVYPCVKRFFVLIFLLF